MEDILTRRRAVLADWHYDQAELLLAFALERDSATALTYAALESRNALERFLIEMSLLATGGQLTEDQTRIAQQKDGAFRLLKDAAANYRRQLEFSNMTLDLADAPFRVAIPDLTTFKRLRTALSDYCHFLLDPDQTIDHPQRVWFIEGVKHVRAALDFLRDLRSQANGVLQPDSLSPEVRDLFDRYVAGRIDPGSVRTRLSIMQPVLEERRRSRPPPLT